MILPHENVTISKKASPGQCPIISTESTAERWRANAQAWIPPYDEWAKESELTHWPAEPVLAPDPFSHLLSDVYLRMRLVHHGSTPTLQFRLRASSKSPVEFGFTRDCNHAPCHSVSRHDILLSRSRCATPRRAALSTKRPSTDRPDARSAEVRPLARPGDAARLRLPLRGQEAEVCRLGVRLEAVVLTLQHARRQASVQAGSQARKRALGHVGTHARRHEYKRLE